MREKILHSFVKWAGVVALAALFLALPATANAQCGGAFNAMGLSALSAKSNQRSALKPAVASNDMSINAFLREEDDDQGPAIVGFWRVEFDITVPGVPHPIDIQDAFQIWNLGGTEVHNPKVDPRGGSLCLGAWREERGTFRLTHRVWSWSTDGVFLGTINLTEAVRVTNHGRNHTGSFALDFFDPDGNPLATPEHPAHVEGVVVGVRISAN